MKLRARSGAGMLALMTLLAGACAKDAAQAPTRAPPPGMSALSLEEYEQQLASNEAALRSHGVAIPATESETRVAVADEARPAGGDVLEEDADPTRPAENTAIGGGEAQTGAGGRPVTVNPTPDESSAPEPFPASPKSVEREDRGSRSGGRRAKEQSGDRCEMICELVAATCDLEAKICDLAQQHRADPRYQNACARATRDCEIAEEACVACAE